MIIIKIMGGFGNQLFQYALAEKMKYLGKCVKFDLSYFQGKDAREYQLDLFEHDFLSATFKEIENIKKKKYRLYDRILRRVFGKSLHHVVDNNHRFMPYIFRLSEVYLEGYWQSEKYFADIREILVDKIRLANLEQDTNNLNVMKEIKENKNSISLHIRRGDYLNTENIDKFGGICNFDYYNESISYFEERFEDCFYYIFTNDVEWVESNFFLENCRIIDWNLGGNDYIDLYLMSLCKHNIIANSSFSWWGAWLNNNKEKLVIAPSTWFNDMNTPDIWCESWIKI